MEMIVLLIEDSGTLADLFLRKYNEICPLGGSYDQHLCFFGPVT